MNGESPLVNTSVFIDYFERFDCRESRVKGGGVKSYNHTN